MILLSLRALFVICMCCFINTIIWGFTGFFFEAMGFEHDFPGAMSLLYHIFAFSEINKWNRIENESILFCITVNTML